MVTLSVPYETPDGIAARRRRALGFTIAFGLFSASTLIGLLQDGFSPSKVMVIFFGLAFAHHLLTYWRLRRQANLAVPDERRAA